MLGVEEQARVSAAITKAERTTSGEIVCVVMRAAADYWELPVLWAALCALAAPWVLMPLTAWPLKVLLFVQVGLFAALALLSLIPGRWRMVLIPPWVKLRRARQAAREVFFTKGMHRTSGRTGVLIFVALAEHHAEVLTDDAFAHKAGEDEWRGIITHLVPRLSRGLLADGLIEAIAATGQILARHAPAGQHDSNELPDKVILL